jgi:hypothetical protein
MECTDPLPYTMTDFRFRGIDERGQVKLAQDPRKNRGMAVIRIDDLKGGAEGYTFDIQWSGASGGAPTGGFQTGGYAGGAGATERTGPYYGRSGYCSMAAERAVDLCRTKVRTRAERDYNRTFSERTGSYRRAAGYRFNCTMDYTSGQVRTVEIRRAGGSPVQAVSTASDPFSRASGYDRNRVFRAWQDAVAARSARDGYRNVRFSSTAVDTNRSSWVSGTITAERGPVSDTFDFGCSPWTLAPPWSAASN